MILLESDWEKYPSAIYVQKTTNPTFLNYSAMLHKLQVRNCLWPLSLLNPGLDGIDPHDVDNLSNEEKLAIKQEASRNPWFYFRECFRVPPAVGLEGNLLRANRGNMSLCWSYLNHIDYYLVQPRQTGKTISSYGLYSWLLYMAYRNARIGVVTKSDELRADGSNFLRRVKDYLPEYLIVKDKADSINDSLVTYKARQNRMVIAVSRSDEAGAYKVGRGNTMPTNGWDEFPYIPWNKVAYSACMASSDAVIQEAIRKNLPYGSIITTTAGRQDDRDGRYAYEMWRDGAPFTEKFYDAKSREHLVDMVKARCSGRKIMITGTWSHNQMGITDEQHYANMAKNNVKGLDADRDYFNIWTISGSDNPIDKNTLRRIVGSKKPFVWTQFFSGNFSVDWMIPESEVERRFKNGREPFIIGADTSEGIGRDSLSLVFVDPTDFSVIATSVINEALIPRYAEFLLSLMVTYERSILIPERKSTGQTFIDYLCIGLHKAGFDPFARIFNNIVQNSDTNTEAFSEISSNILARTDNFYMRRKALFGFSTGTTTRRELYGQCLQFATSKGCDKVFAERLINELAGLVKKNERIDHSSSGHDDTVIAWLLTAWVLLYGRRLDYYGLDPRRVLSKALTQASEAVEDDDFYEIESLNNALEENLELLKNTSNPILIAKYQMRLRHIEEELSLYGVEEINIGAKIEKINSERRVY